MLNTGQIDNGAATFLLGVKPSTDNSPPDGEGDQDGVDFSQIWGEQDETADGALLVEPDVGDMFLRPNDDSSVAEPEPVLVPNTGSEIAPRPILEAKPQPIPPERPKVVLRNDQEALFSHDPKQPILIESGDARPRDGAEKREIRELDHRKLLVSPRFPSQSAENVAPANAAVGVPNSSATTPIEPSVLTSPAPIAPTQTPPSGLVNGPEQGLSNQAAANDSGANQAWTEPPLSALTPAADKSSNKGDEGPPSTHKRMVRNDDFALPQAKPLDGAKTGQVIQNQVLTTITVPHSNGESAQPAISPTLARSNDADLRRPIGTRNAQSTANSRPTQSSTIKSAAGSPDVQPMLAQPNETGQPQFESGGRSVLEPLMAHVQSGSGPQTQQTATTAFPSSYAPKVAAQLVANAVQSGTGTTQITLNPEELGRVRMTLTTTEHGIAVAIAAERPETVDLMRRHVDILVKEFEDLDQGDVAFDFGESDDSSGETESHQKDQKTPEHGQIATDPVPSHLTSAVPTNGLDLKL